LQTIEDRVLRQLHNLLVSKRINTKVKKKIKEEKRKLENKQKTKIFETEKNPQNCITDRVRPCKEKRVC
jgi:hypothetical protein